MNSNLEEEAKVAFLRYVEILESTVAMQANALLTASESLRLHVEGNLPPEKIADFIAKYASLPFLLMELERRREEVFKIAGRTAKEEGLKNGGVNWSEVEQFLGKRGPDE